MCSLGNQMQRHINCALVYSKRCSWSLKNAKVGSSKNLWGYSNALIICCVVCCNCSAKKPTEIDVAVRKMYFVLGLYGSSEWLGISFKLTLHLILELNRKWNCSWGLYWDSLRPFYGSFPDISSNSWRFSMIQSHLVQDSWEFIILFSISCRS